MQEVPAVLELLVVEGADEVHVDGRFALLLIDLLITAWATTIQVLEIAERRTRRAPDEEIWSLMSNKLKGSPSA